MKKLIVVSCSAHSKPTLLEKSLKNIPGNIELKIIRDNKRSINEVYNEIINSTSLGDNDAVLFVHDDVYINCSDLIDRLSANFKTFDVVGLAGSVSANIKEPALWHLMSDKKDHRGAVAHAVTKDGMEPYHITAFGPMPARALLIDGLFIAVKSSVLKSVQFDISNPSRFHYYDLDFSLQCNKNKFKIGVCDIPVVHMSPGLSKVNKEWEDGQQWFLNKWG